MTRKPVTFTPGPWTPNLHHTQTYAGRTYGFIHAGGAVPIAAVTLGVEGMSETEGRANAALIGASTAMYMQLEDARVTLEEAAKLLVERYPSVANNIVNQCAIRCGDVLAKARGEAP